LLLESSSRFIPSILFIFGCRLFGSVFFFFSRFFEGFRSNPRDFLGAIYLCRHRVLLSLCDLQVRRRGFFLKKF
jgi:hypothetical protein